MSTVTVVVTIVDDGPSAGNRTSILSAGAGIDRSSDAEMVWTGRGLPRYAKISKVDWPFRKEVQSGFSLLQSGCLVGRT